MKKMELIAPCHFGLEAVLKREILDLGYDISEVEDGIQRHSTGKIIYRKMENSGLRKQHL